MLSEAFLFGLFGLLVFWSFGAFGAFVLGCAHPSLSSRRLALWPGLSNTKATLRGFGYTVCRERLTAFLPQENQKAALPWFPSFASSSRPSVLRIVLSTKKVDEKKPTKEKDERKRRGKKLEAHAPWHVVEVHLFAEGMKKTRSASEARKLLKTTELCGSTWIQQRSSELVTQLPPSPPAREGTLWKAARAQNGPIGGLAGRADPTSFPLLEAALTGPLRGRQAGGILDCSKECAIGPAWARHCFLANRDIDDSRPLRGGPISTCALLSGIATDSA
eukprot:scaffold1610_cov257-Pinguiococcus_pyrenoidosus.AAC.56